MGRPVLCAVLVTLMTLARSRGESVDMTLMPETSGPVVVDAVVDKIHAHCIFTNDRLFLRRLAYVESHDGQDPKTYRQGFHGGIWQVSEAMLQATQGCADDIKNECDIISSEFGIDWPSVVWTQLRVPLFSGLAASLYMLQRLANTQNMPGDIPSQADVWVHYYHLNEPKGTFITLAAEATRYECSGELDLAFIIDTSGSITMQDYSLQLDFVADVVDALLVETDTVQVASVAFGTIAEVNFNFNTYTNKTDIINSIRNIPKDNGGTNTPMALNLTRAVVFDPRNGARHTAKKVAVLLTDGESYDYNLTVREAERLRSEGVAVFTIGVGYINLQELLAVATEPACTHVYVLDNYANIDSIMYEIQKSTCEAPKVLTITEPVIGIPPDNGTWTVTVGSTRPDNNNTILAVRSNCSIVDIYVSYTNPHPNPAIYAEKYTASDGRPAFLQMEGQSNGLPVFATLMGTRLGDPACLNPGYEMKFETLNPVDVVCREMMTYRDCHPEDFINSPIKDVLCPNTALRSVTNPCTPATTEEDLLIHVHPYDVHYFIRCDLRGRMYVTLCPDNDIFNPATLTCGYEQTTVVDGGVRLPAHYNNPCTPVTIALGLYFFPFADDMHKYVQCDVWGGAWLKNCLPYHVWNDPAHTCVPDHLHEFDPTTVAPFEVVNPCTPQALSDGKYFFPHPCDHAKYIHCDVAGNYYIQSCVPGMFFDPTTSVCLTTDQQPDNPACRGAGK